MPAAFDIEVPQFYLEGMSHDSTPTVTECRASSSCSSPPVVPVYHDYFFTSPIRREPLRQVYYMYASPLDQPPIDVRSEVETIHDAFAKLVEKQDALSEFQCYTA